jgi:hypothetical protein
MIVPQYWAEARHRERIGGKQTTIRRFGWSDDSPEAAQAHAEERLREALEQHRAGTLRSRREAKVAYNGADGLPIREEILARNGDAVLTRNGYGAQCLNTPNVLFLDIDHPEPGATMPCVASLVLFASMGGIVYGLVNRYWELAGVAAGVLALLLLGMGAYQRWYRPNVIRRGERTIRKRISAFLDSRPDWKLRVYRSPNGFRLLAMHRTFEPRSAEVDEAFRELGVDYLYALMCRNQNCFRARVSPKPWRMGMEERFRPRPGVWPVKPEWLPIRAAWVARYEELAKGFSACRFEEELGTGSVHPAALAVQRWHDELSRATSGLPMA